MKILIFSSAILAITSAMKLSVLEENQLFTTFLSTHKIRLGKVDDIQSRQKKFFERFYDVEEHNAANSTYKLEINRFSHLNDEELSQLTGFIYTPPDGSENVYTPGRVGRSGPASWDWRSSEGVVRPVQNQGGCASCWAFAGVGAIEGQMAIKKKSYDKLSEQEVIECVVYAGVLRGCNGGFASMVFDHAKVNKGVTNSTFDSYAATVNGKTCNITRPRAIGSAVKTWSVVPNKEDAIKEALFNVGPLYITLYTSTDLYGYKSGVYTDEKKRCGNNNPNHAVLLVGYGTLNGVDYWLLKNSWGPSWGDQGYFKLKRGSKLCKINVGATFPNLA